MLVNIATLWLQKNLLWSVHLQASRQTPQYSCALCYQSTTEHFNEQSLNWVFAGSTKPTLPPQPFPCHPSRTGPFFFTGPGNADSVSTAVLLECGSGPLSIHYKAITLSWKILLLKNHRMYLSYSLWVLAIWRYRGEKLPWCMCKPYSRKLLVSKTPNPKLLRIK